MSRMSVRRFMSEPVPQAVVEDILRVASRAPSGANTQPWQVHVLTGETLRTLVQELEHLQGDPAALASLAPDEYAYYPSAWRSPYIDRRRKVGGALYRLLGIQRGDTARMEAQHARNFRFFDAPVGLLFTIDRDLDRGNWLDYGMFLQNIMVAARARGLGTCAQAAFIHRHQLIARHLHLEPRQMLVCGMSLGYADTEAVENSLRSEREEIASFVNFYS